MLPNKNHWNTLAASEAAALRVAIANTPCRVAGLAEGMTISCAPRLAWRAGNLHRGAPLDASMPR